MSKIDRLKEIILKKKERLALAKQQIPEEELKVRVQAVTPARAFIEAIKKPHQISLIAEIKKASPSQGIIRQDFNHLEIARAYQEAGVQAISVLTEEDYFLGNISYLNEIKNLVSVPVLRKDFILEPYQVYESRFYGADAILLIADLLTQDEILQFTAIAAELGMDSLVEVHNEKELKKVLKLKGVALIGINNRDLRTFEVDPKTTEKLFTLIPKDKLVVVESGLKTYQDILFLKILGVHAVLIGTAFMQAENIADKVKELMAW
ncbi:MAG: indole-3-glycerol phosphate synthase TrpC [Candidatus Omnitrophota bacterium]|nr:indole-3-glycerol phosphate synthase TrpC [Candidatus Omnitrophota bacterium]